MSVNRREYLRTGNNGEYLHSHRRMKSHDDMLRSATLHHDGRRAAQFYGQLQDEEESEQDDSYYLNLSDAAGIASHNHRQQQYQGHQQMVSQSQPTVGFRIPAGPLQQQPRIALPTTTKGGLGLKPVSECNICFEPFHEVRRVPRKLQCGHIYCTGE